MNKKGLTRWSHLSTASQRKLLQQCTPDNVIQLDNDGGAKVVGVFFGMELNIDSPYEYLFPDDVHGCSTNLNEA